MNSTKLVIVEKISKFVCGDEAVCSCYEEEETAGCWSGGGENDEVGVEETAGFVGTGDEDSERFSHEVVMVDLSSGVSATFLIWKRM